MMGADSSVDQESTKGQFSMAMHAFFQTGSWLLARWKSVFLAPVLVGVFAYCATLMVDPKYRAQATLLLDSEDNASGLGLKAIAGGDLGALLGGKMGGKNEMPLLEILLKGNSLGRAMLRDTGLRKEWELDKKNQLPENELRTWSGAFRYEITEDEAIVLQFESKSPQRAVRIVEKVYAWLDSAQTAIKQGRAKKKFIACQTVLTSREAQLSQAEDSLTSFQIRNKIFAPAEQLKSSIQGIVELEVEKEKTDILRRVSETEDGLLSAKTRKLDELYRQLDRKLSESNTTAGFARLPPQQALPKMLEYGRRWKQVQVHAAVITLLTQQLEQYRLDVVKSVSPLNLIEAPVVPKKRSSPPRVAIAQAAMIVTFLLAVFGGVGLADFREWRSEKGKRGQPQTNVAR